MGRGSPVSGPHDSITPEGLGYLRLLREAADHVSAHDAEREQIEAVFLVACRRYGLDEKTIALCIEVLF